MIELHEHVRGLPIVVIRCNPLKRYFGEMKATLLRFLDPSVDLKNEPLTVEFIGYGAEEYDWVKWYDDITKRRIAALKLGTAQSVPDNVEENVDADGGEADGDEEDEEGGNSADDEDDDNDDEDDDGGTDTESEGNSDDNGDWDWEIGNEEPMSADEPEAGDEWNDDDEEDDYAEQEEEGSDDEDEEQDIEEAVLSG